MKVKITKYCPNIIMSAYGHLEQIIDVDSIEQAKKIMNKNCNNISSMNLVVDSCDVVDYEINDSPFKFEVINK